MDNRLFPQQFRPVVTGTLPLGTGTVPAAKPAGEASGPSFQDVLRENLNRQSNLNFSKHAVTRAVERGIDLSETRMSRLNEGVKLAEQKGLNDTLILIDRTAFLVSIKNSTVITTVNEEDLKGNVFTNIDGTVII